MRGPLFFCVVNTAMECEQFYKPAYFTFPKMVESLLNLSAQAVWKKYCKHIVNEFSCTNKEEIKQVIKKKWKKKSLLLPKEVKKIIFNNIPERSLVRCKYCEVILLMEDCFFWQYRSKSSPAINMISGKLTPRKVRDYPPKWMYGMGKVLFTCKTCTPPESPTKKIKKKTRS